jgi:hypothetical protein
MVLWNLLDGEPSHSGPHLGTSESMRGGTPGTIPHHVLLGRDDALLTFPPDNNSLWMKIMTNLVGCHVMCNTMHDKRCCTTYSFR